MLMGKVSQKLDPNYRHELVKALADCLITEPLCFTIWGNIYTKYLYQSSLLLSYIGEYPTFTFYITFTFSISKLSEYL